MIYTIKTNDGCMGVRFVSGPASCTYSREGAVRYPDFGAADIAASNFAREHEVRAWAEELTTTANPERN